MTCKRVLKVKLIYELTLEKVHVDNVVSCATCVLGAEDVFVRVRNN